MKLKLILLTLAGSTALGIEIVPFQGIESRDLQNRNCDVSGEVTCKLVSDNSDCKDFAPESDPILENTCNLALPVVMTFKLCNDNPQEKIVLKSSESYSAVYNANERLSFSEIAPAKCETITKNVNVNTCKRNFFIGDQKLEGWKTEANNFGNYCHFYYHYQYPIKRYSLPDFKWRINQVQCFIKETRQSCADYLKALPSTDSQNCQVDVEYVYDVENISDSGTPCVDFSFVVASVNGKDGNISVNNFKFCPSDLMVLTDTRSENLCDYAEKEIGLELSLNGQQGFPKAFAALAFPSPDGGIGPILTMVNFKCEVHNDASPNLSCAEYIKLKEKNNLDCVTTTVYRSKIKNTGDACFLLDTVNLDVGETTFNINTENWNYDKKNFCPGEILVLQKRVRANNLCEMAGNEIDVQIKVPKAGLSDFGMITFPEPDNITPPTPTIPDAPTPTIVITPTAPTPACSTTPKSITMKLNKFQCNVSNNIQSTRRTRKRTTRRLGHQVASKGGKGSNKSPALPPSTLSCESGKCVDHDSITEVTHPTVSVSEKKRDGSTVVLFKSFTEFDLDFEFRTTEMPDCLYIEIYDGLSGGFKLAQEVVIEAGCSLKVGDKFGAIEIVGISN